MKILLLDRYDVSLKQLTSQFALIGEKRFSKQFVESWSRSSKNFAIVTVAYDDDNKLLGLSGFQVSSDGKRTMNSFTAVHPDNRRAGVGRKLLESKIGASHEYFGLPLRATVSSTNEPAIGMCVAANMTLAESKPRGDGKDGEFRVYQSLW